MSNTNQNNMTSSEIVDSLVQYSDTRQQMSEGHVIRKIYNQRNVSTSDVRNGGVFLPEQKVLLSKIKKICKARWTPEEARTDEEVTHDMYILADLKLKRSDTPKVLIVMNNRFVAAGIAIMLKQFNCIVFMCCDGAEAYIRYIKKRTINFTVCICDWECPGKIGGRDLYIYEQENGGSMPFITQVPVGVSSNYYRQTGADFVFRKPLCVHILSIKELLFPYKERCTYPLKLLKTPSNHAALADILLSIVSNREYWAQQTLEVNTEHATEDTDILSYDIGIKLLEQLITMFRNRQGTGLQAVEEDSKRHTDDIVKAFRAFMGTFNTMMADIVSKTDELRMLREYRRAKEGDINKEAIELPFSSVTVSNECNVVNSVNNSNSLTYDIPSEITKVVMGPSNIASADTSDNAHLEVMSKKDICNDVDKGPINNKQYNKQKGNVSTKEYIAAMCEPSMFNAYRNFNVGDMSNCEITSLINDFRSRVIDLEKENRLLVNDIKHFAQYKVEVENVMKGNNIYVKYEEGILNEPISRPPNDEESSEGFITEEGNTGDRRTDAHINAGETRCDKVRTVGNITQEKNKIIRTLPSLGVESSERVLMHRFPGGLYKNYEEYSRRLECSIMMREDPFGKTPIKNISPVFEKEEAVTDVMPVTVAFSTLRDDGRMGKDPTHKFSETLGDILNGVAKDINRAIAKIMATHPIHRVLLSDLSETLRQKLNRLDMDVYVEEMKKYVESRVRLETKALDEELVRAKQTIKKNREQTRLDSSRQRTVAMRQGIAVIQMRISRVLALKVRQQLTVIWYYRWRLFIALKATRGGFPIHNNINETVNISKYGILDAELKYKKDESVSDIMRSVRNEGKFGERQNSTVAKKTPVTVDLVKKASKVTVDHVVSSGAASLSHSSIHMGNSDNMYSERRSAMEHNNHSFNTVSDETIISEPNNDMSEGVIEKTSKKMHHGRLRKSDVFEKSNTVGKNLNADQTVKKNPHDNSFSLENDTGREKSDSKSLSKRGPTRLTTGKNSQNHSKNPVSVRRATQKVLIQKDCGDVSKSSYSVEGFNSKSLHSQEDAEEWSESGLTHVTDDAVMGLSLCSASLTVDVNSCISAEPSTSSEKCVQSKYVKETDNTVSHVHSTVPIEVSRKQSQPNQAPLSPYVVNTEATNDRLTNENTTLSLIDSPSSNVDVDESSERRHEKDLANNKVEYMMKPGDDHSTLANTVPGTQSPVSETVPFSIPLMGSTKCYNTATHITPTTLINASDTNASIVGTESVVCDNNNSLTQDISHVMYVTSESIVSDRDNTTEVIKCISEDTDNGNGDEDEVYLAVPFKAVQCNMGYMPDFNNEGGSVDTCEHTIEDTNIISLPPFHQQSYSSKTNIKAETVDFNGIVSRRSGEQHYSDFVAISHEEVTDTDNNDRCVNSFGLLNKEIQELCGKAKPFSESSDGVARFSSPSRILRDKNNENTQLIQSVSQSSHIEPVYQPVLPVQQHRFTVLQSDVFHSNIPNTADDIARHTEVGTSFEAEREFDSCGTETANLPTKANCDPHENACQTVISYREKPVKRTVINTTPLDSDNSQASRHTHKNMLPSKAIKPVEFPLVGLSMSETPIDNMCKERRNSHPMFDKMTGKTFEKRASDLPHDNRVEGYYVELNESGEISARIIGRSIAHDSPRRGLEERRKIRLENESVTTPSPSCRTQTREVERAVGKTMRHIHQCIQTIRDAGVPIPISIESLSDIAALAKGEVASKDLGVVTKKPSVDEQWYYYQVLLEHQQSLHHAAEMILRETVPSSSPEKSTLRHHPHVIVPSKPQHSEYEIEGPLKVKGYKSLFPQSLSNDMPMPFDQGLYPSTDRALPQCRYLNYGAEYPVFKFHTPLRPGRFFIDWKKSRRGRSHQSLQTKLAFPKTDFVLKPYPSYDLGNLPCVSFSGPLGMLTPKAPQVSPTTVTTEKRNLHTLKEDRNFPLEKDAVSKRIVPLQSMTFTVPRSTDTVQSEVKHERDRTVVGNTIDERYYSDRGHSKNGCLVPMKPSNDHSHGPFTVPRNPTKSKAA